MPGPISWRRKAVIVDFQPCRARQPCGQPRDVLCAWSAVGTFGLGGATIVLSWHPGARPRNAHRGRMPASCAAMMDDLAFPPWLGEVGAVITAIVGHCYTARPPAAGADSTRFRARNREGALPVQNSAVIGDCRRSLCRPFATAEAIRGPPVPLANMRHGRTSVSNCNADRVETARRARRHAGGRRRPAADNGRRDIPTPGTSPGPHRQPAGHCDRATLLRHDRHARPRTGLGPDIRPSLRPHAGRTPAARGRGARHPPSVYSVLAAPAFRTQVPTNCRSQPTLRCSRRRTRSVDGEGRSKPQGSARVIAAPAGRLQGRLDRGRGATPGNRTGRGHTHLRSTVISLPPRCRHRGRTWADTAFPARVSAGRAVAPRALSGRSCGARKSIALSHSSRARPSMPKSNLSRTRPSYATRTARQPGFVARQNLPLAEIHLDSRRSGFFRRIREIDKAAGRSPRTSVPE